MDKKQKVDSHLFTIRVWCEETADDQKQYRGKLHHIPSGQIRHFRGWTTLIPLMLDILRRYPDLEHNEPNEEQSVDHDP